ncbi:hypothetical protein FDP41_006027 [Naegleria fowleri]|uniref:Uncharacterized protein n=1 Tax=Naegleria fowleri TaxID=5763 RepID=A0A6A5BJ78_NAEFO|nr:uncharacterized protein FDP41_006027 [Naegleria fowleri]KAF0974922.1 hypothetical protein FDP41_006027 [Naegleria fowleri]
MGTKRRLFSSSLSRISTQFEEPSSSLPAIMYKKSLLNNSMINQQNGIHYWSSPAKRKSSLSTPHTHFNSPKHSLMNHSFTPSLPLQHSTSPFERVMMIHDNEESSGSDTSSVGSLSSPVSTPRVYFDSILHSSKKTKDIAKTPFLDQFNSEHVRVSKKAPLLKLEFVKIIENHRKTCDHMVEDLNFEVPSFLNDSYNCMDFWTMINHHPCIF